MKGKIIEILKEIRPEFSFNIDDNFIANGMLDSFDIIALVVALDKEFNISIDGMDILPENFSSVEKIESLLKKMLPNNEIGI
jgi:acyl carrier protein